MKLNKIEIIGIAKFIMEKGKIEDEAIRAHLINILNSYNTNEAILLIIDLLRKHNRKEPINKFNKITRRIQTILKRSKQ